MCHNWNKNWFTKEEDRDVQIPCFAYALAIAMKLKTQNYAHVNNWSRCRTMVRRECMRLHQKTGIPVGAVTVHQYTLFQQQLPPGYCLVIVNDVSLPGTKKRLHRVNYVVAMSFCNKCGEQTCNEYTTTYYFNGLHGGDALSDFCFWATSNPVNRSTTFIAHNAKSYDTHFVLDYLVSQGNTPKLVLQGGKLLSLKLISTDATFIDSLSFLNMTLTSFTKTIYIPEVKGTFPHLFN